MASGHRYAITAKDLPQLRYGTRGISAAGYATRALSTTLHDRVGCVDTRVTGSFRGRARCGHSCSSRQLSFTNTNEGKVKPTKWDKYNEMIHHLFLAAILNEEVCINWRDRKDKERERSILWRNVLGVLLYIILGSVIHEYYFNLRK